MRFLDDSGGFQMWCVERGGVVVAVTLRALVQTFNEPASFVLGNFRFRTGTKLSSKFQHPRANPVESRV